MILTYRKRKDDRDAWHFCSNCSQWPTLNVDFEEVVEKPSTGEFCKECESRKASNNCS
jgi:hypothetical protein